jgi:hypothetical protein
MSNAGALLALVGGCGDGGRFVAHPPGCVLTDEEYAEFDMIEQFAETGVLPSSVGPRPDDDRDPDANRRNTGTVCASSNNVRARMVVSNF